MCEFLEALSQLSKCLVIVVRELDIVEYVVNGINCWPDDVVECGLTYPKCQPNIGILSAGQVSNRDGQFGSRSQILRAARSNVNINNQQYMHNSSNSTNLSWILLLAMNGSTNARRRLNVLRFIRNSFLYSRSDMTSISRSAYPGSRFR
jgi:hypothetical protein